MSDLKIEQLCNLVALECKLSPKTVRSVLDALYKVTLKQLELNQRIYLLDFGAFEVYERPSGDKVMGDFLQLLKLLTEMASIRTIVWRLATEVKKTQRRVNALDKLVIPQTRETKVYIESVLEERERENVFVLKSLKSRQS